MNKTIELNEQQVEWLKTRLQIIIEDEWSSSFTKTISVQLLAKLQESE